MAYDAARDIAHRSPGVGPGRGGGQVVRRATQSLGTYGHDVHLRAVDGDTTILRVQAPGLDLLPAMIDVAATVGALDRRISIRNVR